MKDIDHIKALAKVDLNLLIVLRAIDEHRHITRAATFLGVSQSAVSHALSRLRDVFSDDLYVKTPRGMVPTPRAERLVHLTEPVIQSLRHVFFQDKEFTPSSLQRSFRVHTTDLIETLLLPPILKLQKNDAPGLKVSFQNVGFSLPKQDLEEGRTDLAIAGFFGELPEGFYRQKLFADSFKCAVRRDHPAIKGRMTLAHYCAFPHILIAPGGDLSGSIDKILLKKKISRKIVAGTSGFLAAVWAVAQSDAILTAPSKLLDEFESYLPIQSMAVPIETSAITIVQVWHERQNRDPAHKWFRERIQAILT